ncbi:hypothetical protein OF83DRAFT_523181 [Amylostereum chailletii]|nr:hypothetical protein OF83DRAFT_523181 [Amylostereum chailletii]
MSMTFGRSTLIVVDWAVWTPLSTCAQQQNALVSRRRLRIMFYSYLSFDRCLTTTLQLCNLPTQLIDDASQRRVFLLQSVGAHRVLLLDICGKLVSHGQGLESCDGGGTGSRSTTVLKYACRTCLIRCRQSTRQHLPRSKSRLLTPGRCIKTSTLAQNRTGLLFR